MFVEHATSVSNIIVIIIISSSSSSSSFVYQQADKTQFGLHVSILAY